jgi:hypothetical protein
MIGTGFFAAGVGFGSGMVFLELTIPVIRVLVKETEGGTVPDTLFIKEY